MLTVTQKISALRARPVAVLAAAVLAGGLASVPAAASAAGHSPSASASHQSAATAGSYGLITGVVRGGGGKPLAGACVTAASPVGPVTVRTGSTGRYFLAGLRPGSYTVSYAACGTSVSSLPLWYGGSYLASGAAHIVVRAGRPVTLAPVSLHPAHLVIATPAQQASMRADATLAKSPGSISGTVRGRSGKGLAGICVTVWSLTANVSTGIDLSTARNGSYTIEPALVGLPDHGLRVQFTAGGPFGCGNSGNYAPQWWKDVTSESKATALTVKPGHHLKNINAKLAAGGEISGVVRANSRTGHALRGICVSALPVNPSEFDFAFPNIAFTRSNGSYEMKDLGTGKYDLQFTPGSECGGANYGNGDYLDYDDPHAVHVVAGKHVGGINAVLRLGGMLSGVVSAAGARVADGCVDITDDGFPVGEFTTGANGSYSLQQLEPGRYQLGFSGGCGNKGSYAPQYYPDQQNAADAATLTIGYGQARSGVDASLLPGAAIRGLVTSRTGKPTGYVCVQAVPPQLLGPSAGSLLAFITLDSGLPYGQTGTKGAYTIANLAPGSYYLEFFACGSANLASQWYSPAPGQTGPSQVSAVAGAVTKDINATVGPGGVISGTVRNSKGQPQPNICVTAEPAAASPLAALGSALAETSAHGKYEINQLATGDYKVEFEPCGATEFASDWYGGAAFAASAKSVPVTAGRTTRNINGTLRAGQSISGRVTGVTGKPLGSVCVTANDPQGNIVSLAFTGKTGRYSITELAPGSYTLQFSPCTLETLLGISSAEAGNSVSGEQATTDSAGPVELAAISKTGVKVTGRRSATGINAVLRPGGHISGTVLGGTGPVRQPGICVTATPKTGDGVAGVAITGTAGTYRIGGLAAGSYQVLFNPDCAIGTAPLAPQLDPTLVKVTPPGTRSGVDATLASDGQITGTVTNQSSADVAGVCVTAQPLAADAAPVVAVTATSGSYSLPALTPGGYTVRFSVGCGATGYQTQWWDDATSAAAATPVTVPAGGTVAGIGAELIATP